MTGWVWLAAIGGAAFAALRLLGVPRVLGWAALAALALGAAGYAWQQHANLAGHPVEAATLAIEVEPGMVAFRTMIFPPDPAATAVLAAADARLRQGDPAAAAQLLLAAIARAPRDPALWTGLGSALSVHDGGQVSPAAQFAFRRAVLLAPDQPGPPFFLGLAFVQAGDLSAARAAWLRALALTPRDAPYRIDIAERLVMVDQFLAMRDAPPPSRTGR